MNYWELKELAGEADVAEGEERKKLVEKLMEELPELDPFEGFDPVTVLIAKEIARRKRLMLCQDGICFLSNFYNFLHATDPAISESDEYQEENAVLTIGSFLKSGPCMIEENSVIYIVSRVSS